MDLVLDFNCEMWPYNAEGGFGFCAAHYTNWSPPNSPTCYFHLAPVIYRTEEYEEDIEECIGWTYVHELCHHLGERHSEKFQDCLARESPQIHAYDTFWP